MRPPGVADRVGSARLHRAAARQRALLDCVASRDLVPIVRSCGRRRPGTAAAWRASRHRRASQVEPLLADPDAGGSAHPRARGIPWHRGVLPPAPRGARVRCASRSTALPGCERASRRPVSRRSTGLIGGRRRSRRSGCATGATSRDSRPGTSPTTTRSAAVLAGDRDARRPGRGGARCVAARWRRAQRRGSRRRKSRTPDSRSSGWAKSGARELNYVSDVDVIFVVEATGRSRRATGRSRSGPDSRCRRRAASRNSASEPALWEVDANLRPEGKDGALVRTLESHFAYYERWAQGWEFQALLKARPLAGDLDLGDRYVAGVAPLVWSSASREGFRRVRAADAGARHREHPGRRARHPAQARPRRPA